MISNAGWHYFDMPSCVAPGQYLMRVELLALHSASTANQFQFYVECAQIEITGSGTNSGSDLVSFPGAYSASDPGILISIYGTAGKPDNGGRAYPIPGPRPITCSGNGGGSNPTTTSAAPTSKTSSPPAATTSAGTGGGGATVPLYAQCGGQGYTGATTCASGTCKVSNEWYSQCLP